MKRSFLAALAACLLAALAQAEPWAGPGDTTIRNDLQLLNDAGLINITLSAWPVAWGDVASSLDQVDRNMLAPELRLAFNRIRWSARHELRPDFGAFEVVASGASHPRILRTFEDTPREDAEATAGISWVGDRFAFNLRATYADSPFDGDEFRPDGTYVGMVLGNWMLSAGWLERWWGPGRDSSMILSTNARPPPSIGIQRISSLPSDSKWFRWMGPWTLSSFFGLLDDDREIKNGVLFGLRGSFRPLRGLEIGLSRTAQMCGEGRKCDLQIFFNMLLGKDNAVANVNPENEPGNQLGGIDMRWNLPKQIPVAIYMQWIAEDTRQTGGSLHQWLEQAGVEFWGTIGNISHRTHIEWGDTLAKLGAMGEGSPVPNSAYNHFIFRTGYRYNGRAIGHFMDGDGRSISLGSTFVQSDGHTINVSARYVEINRAGQPDLHHTLSPTPQEFTDIQVSYERLTRFGRFYAGVGYSKLDDQASALSTTDTSAFLRWSLH